MGRRPNTARFPLAGTGAPEVQVMKYATGQTFTAYALVTLNASGEVIEHAGGTDLALLGVSLGAPGTGPGYGMANDAQTQFVTGRSQEIPIAIANRNTVFSIRGVNGGTDPVTPLQTHIGEEYGILKTAGGDWVLDLAETTTKIFEIVDIDTDLNCFMVKVLEAAMLRP